jgi:hypothetical protein
MKFFKFLISTIFSILVLFGCKSTFEHPAYLNSGKTRCGSIYLLSFGRNYSCAPSEIPRLEYPLEDF